MIATIRLDQGELVAGFYSDLLLGSSIPRTYLAKNKVIFKHTHGLVNDSVFVGWITIDSAVMMVSNPSLLSHLEHVEKIILKR